MPPCLCQLLDWINNQDLCLLNVDIPTRTGPSGSMSLLDLTLLSPTLHNKVQFYVHLDMFDSDLIQSSFFLLSRLLLFMCLSFLAGVLQQQLLTESECFQCLLTKSSRISALKSSLTRRVLPKIGLVNLVHGGMTHEVIFCESNVNRFGMSALGVLETSGLRTKNTLPSFGDTSNMQPVNIGTTFATPAGTMVKFIKISNVLQRETLPMEIISSKIRTILPRLKIKLMLFCNTSRKKNVFTPFWWTLVMETPTLMPRSRSQNLLRL